MNQRLFSLCTPCPEGFIFCGEFRARDFRSAPFALHAQSLEAAGEFLGSHMERLTGVILVPGKHLSTRTLTEMLSVITFSPTLLPYLADFAGHQLRQLDQIVSNEERTARLELEHERLSDNSRRAAEEFEQFRSSLLREMEERRAAERHLADSEERLRQIISSTGEAIYGVDTEGKCIFANESCLSSLGYQYIGDVLGRNMHELIHYHTPDGKPVPVEECRIFKAFREGVGVKVEGEYFWHRDGTCFPVEYSSYPIRKDGTIVGGVVIWRDITERKRLEQELRDNRSFLDSIIEHIPNMVFVKDAAELRFVKFNRVGEELLGIPREELIGKSDYDLFPKDEADFFTSKDREVLSGARVVDIPEETIQTKFGQRVLHTKKIAVTDHDGVPRYLLGISEDITDKKQAEEERHKLEQQLLHAQKLESLGVLAGGIAHDFNNILTAIIGNADLALMRINRESPAVDNLHRIEQAASQAADLAKQMLAYSGKGKFMVESLDMNRLLEEMLHMLEVSISKKAVLRLNLHRPLPLVDADASQVRQILMNLVINASEAIGDRSGVITVTTGCMECDSAYLKDVWLAENLSDGLYVYLEISDNGCGMDSETLGCIFDPFFTTKFTGRGLGMAAVLGIVRGHRGAIKVYSEPGHGTSFKILLPASGKPVGSFTEETENEEWRGSGTVLLVDDEENVRSIGKEMLEELGFTVITANDGRFALDVFAATPGIHFVILDLTMPHMDGEQCFRELRRIDPDVCVLMSSGYNEQEVTQKFSGKGLAGFIQKPYKMSELRKAIRGMAGVCEQN
jgi:PAS domain S-box-containing protein